MDVLNGRSSFCLQGWLCCSIFRLGANWRLQQTCQCPDIIAVPPVPAGIVHVPHLAL